jgi:hypothetical protein
MEMEEEKDKVVKAEWEPSGLTAAGQRRLERVGQLRLDADVMESGVSERGKRRKTRRSVVR